jgi:hypothetical protein
VDPTTREPLYTPANRAYTPAVDPVTGEPLQAPGPANQGGQPLEAAEEPKLATFEERLTQQVIETMHDVRGGEYAETWELVYLEGPKKMTEVDPQLQNSPTARRYQARFRDFEGKIIEISVNYDLDTDRFGTIKWASGK